MLLLKYLSKQKIKKQVFKIVNEHLPTLSKGEAKKIDNELMISNLLKQNDRRYEKYWKRHYEILNIIQFNLYSKAINEDNIFNKYSEQCIKLAYEDLELAPMVIEWQKEEAKILNEKYVPLSYGSHKYLLKLLEKQRKYSEAIFICDKCIELGLNYDGTKGGIKGRKQKLIKLQNKYASIGT